MVQKPIDDSQGWLEGRNIRTRQFGLFPGTYCEIHEIDVQVRTQKPVLPPKRDIEPKETLKINGHNIKHTTFMKPVWCYICLDYIWGQGRKSLMCSNCSLAAHAGCHSAFNRYVCQEGSFTANVDEQLAYKAIESWNNEDVLEWLAAAKFHTYIQAFHDYQVTGQMLRGLNEEFLEKNLGIGPGLHVKLILMCIDELFAKPEPGPDLSKLQTQTRSEAASHKLYEHTFTTAQTCDLCNKIMFGLFRQGYICAACGIQCHRQCAISSVQQCDHTYFRGRRVSDPEGD